MSGVAFELTLVVHEARYLPALPRGHAVRVQCMINGDRQDTGPSAWGRGTKSRDATWPREQRKLSWRMDGDSFRRLKAHSPKFKLSGNARFQPLL